MKMTEGACPYCGQIYMLDAAVETEQEAQDAAVEKCSCLQAGIIRKSKRQYDLAKETVEDLLEEEHREILDGIMLVIWSCIRQKTKSMTINMEDGNVYRISRCGTKIKIAKEKKEKKNMEV